MGVVYEWESCVYRTTHILENQKRTDEYAYRRTRKERGKYAFYHMTMPRAQTRWPQIGSTAINQKPVERQIHNHKPR